MDLTPIANKLENEGLGTPGTDLFVNFMPMEAADAVLLRSPLSGTEIDPNLPGYYRCYFTAIVRTRDFVQGQEKMREIMRVLTIYDEDVDDIFVKRMYPKTLPVYFPISDGNFYEIQVTFDLVFVGTEYGR